MPIASFEDMAAHGESRYADATLAVAVPTLRTKVRRRRTVRAAGVGAAVVGAGGIVAVSMLTAGQSTAPAGPTATVLDPSTIATVPGTSGSNLVGTCDGADASAAELMGAGALADPVPVGAYRIVSRETTCDLASVDGGQIISASSTIRRTNGGARDVYWLRTTITNVTSSDIAFDLASPTFSLNLPAEMPAYFSSMAAARPLVAEESWSDASAVESWGGHTAAASGASSFVTPVMARSPQPGTAWGLALLEHTDRTSWYLSTSAGSVTLGAGQSFVIESTFTEDDYLAVTGADYSDAGGDQTSTWAPPDAKELASYHPRVSLLLQATADGDAPRTLLVATDVPLTPEN